MPDYDGLLSELSVDLDAIAANWLSLKARLSRDADCAAVVKADAYGLGARQVAPHLYKQGCRHFFVAHAGEAADIAPELSRLTTLSRGDAAHIYLLNGPWGMPAGDMAAAGFVPVLNSLEDVRYWADAAAGAAAVLHVDTGMNRLGLSVADLDAPDMGDLLSKINLRYVMSHLAVADDPQDDMNARQLAAFRAATAKLGRPLRLSLANSAGILLGPDYHFDLARPGCALYGIHPRNAGPNPMRGVVCLRARITQLRKLAAGDTVGYGAAYRVPAGSAIKTVATVALGYADGYQRHLTGHGALVVGGAACPVLGRVSMDSVVIDVTDAAHVRAGDWAEVIGPQQPVDAVAAQAGTIGYEILTSLGRRYARRYLGET